MEAYTTQKSPNTPQFKNFYTRACPPCSGRDAPLDHDRYVLLHFFADNSLGGPFHLYQGELGVLTRSVHSEFSLSYSPSDVFFFLSIKPISLNVFSVCDRISGSLILQLQLLMQPCCSCMKKNDECFPKYSRVDVDIFITAVWPLLMHWHLRDVRSQIFKRGFDLCSTWDFFNTFYKIIYYKRQTFLDLALQDVYFRWRLAQSLELQAWADLFIYWLYCYTV